MTRAEIHQRFERIVADTLGRLSAEEEGDEPMPVRLRPGGIPDDEEAYERMVRDAYL